MSENLDCDAIERREREARRLAEVCRFKTTLRDKTWSDEQVWIVADMLEQQADDIKALREALAERDKQLAEADAVIARNEGEWAFQGIMEIAPWYDAAMDRHRARQEAKPHE